jgi:hypothetical protein
LAVKTNQNIVQVTKMDTRGVLRPSRVEIDLGSSPSRDEENTSLEAAQTAPIRFAMMIMKDNKDKAGV